MSSTARLRTTEASLSRANARIAELEARLARLTQEKSELSQKWTVLNTNYSELARARDFDLDQLGRLSTQLASLRTTNGACQADAKKMKRDLQQCTALLTMRDQANRCQRKMRELASNGTIRFALSSAQLDQSSFETLRQIADAAKKCPKVRITIEGHTDSSGSAGGNKFISQQRAESVVDFLADNGIPRIRMTPIGYGEEKPIATNDTREAAHRTDGLSFR